MNDIFETPGTIGEYEVRYFAHRLAQKYEFVRYSTIGSSVHGRDIVALEFGAGGNAAVVVGGTHGMEWASVVASLRLCYEIARSVALDRPLFGIDFASALLERGLTVIPLLNPDGFEIFRRGTDALPKSRPGMRRMVATDSARWQANGRGVDINHNFNAGFYKAAKTVRAMGISSRAPTRYGGPFPFSEPEARAIRTLCEKSRFRSLYALHSQGEEIFWRYGDTLPERSMYMAGVLRDLTGYALSSPEAAASHAGLKDWFIKKYNRPGFTIELGKGKNPLPYTDFEDIWQRVFRALCVAAIL